MAQEDLGKRIERADLGGIRSRYINFSASTTIAPGVTWRLGYDRRIFANITTSSGDVTIGLPDLEDSIPSHGMELTFRKNTAANTLHLDATTYGGHFINGAAGLSLFSYNETATIVLINNGNWFRL